jgi:hypothetical protein
LDINPRNILTLDDIFTEQGIRAYMAGMYRALPMEDFNFNPANSGRGGYFQRTLVHLGAGSGEAVSAQSGHGQRHPGGWWNEAFALIRQANVLIAELPNRPELATHANAWIAEAKFIRAWVYFKLVKRYGGMPIITYPQMLDIDRPENLYVARVSHEATFDFILSDLAFAIENMPAVIETGRANRYVAAGLKSRVALSAATTARYGSDVFADWEIDGVLLQGIPSGRAVGFFQQAWEAANMVSASGRYELHNSNPNLVDNWTEIFFRTTRESMFTRYFNYLTHVHSWDAVMSPVRMTTTYGGRFGISLCWVELFDGLPIGEDGRFNSFCPDGYHIVHNSAQEFWAGTEPRLQAQIFTPGMEFRGMVIDIRTGTFCYSVDPATQRFRNFSVDDGGTNFNYEAHQFDPRIEEQGLFRNPDNPDGIIMFARGNLGHQAAHTFNPGAPNELTMYLSGRDGPDTRWNSNGNTPSGLIGRKFINTNMPLEQVRLHTSTQPWVEMRYAEILLNRAEAAIELAQSGVATHNGVDMLQDAFNAINAVRARGGATLLTSPAELSTAPAYTRFDRAGQSGPGGWVVAPNRGLQLLRIERYKELANEAIIYWDLRRWFTFHLQFDRTNRRGIYSFLFANGATVDPVTGFADGPTIFDVKQGEHWSEQWTYNPLWYYDHIPAAQINNNPLLQPNRGQ